MTKAPQTEIVTLILNEVKTICPSIVLGPLPQSDGCAMQMTGGTREDVYLNKAQRRYLTLLFLCKNKSQETAFNALCVIGNHLRGITLQPKQSQLLACLPETDPQIVSVTNGVYIYSMVVHAHYYF